MGKERQRPDRERRKQTKKKEKVSRVNYIKGRRMENKGLLMTSPSVSN